MSSNIHLIKVKYKTNLPVSNYFYHIALNYNNTIYDLVPFVEGGFRELKPEVFYKEYPNKLGEYSCVNNIITIDNKKIFVNNNEEIEKRINKVKEDYLNKKFVYHALSIQCEMVCFYILSSKHSQLYTKNSLVNKDLFNLCGKNYFISSFIEEIKEMKIKLCNNEILPKQEDFFSQIYDFLTIYIQDYYDIDKNLSLEFNIISFLDIIIKLYE